MIDEVTLKRLEKDLTQDLKNRVMAKVAFAAWLDFVPSLSEEMIGKYANILQEHVLAHPDGQRLLGVDRVDISRDWTFDDVMANIHEAIRMDEELSEVFFRLEAWFNRVGAQSQKSEDERKGLKRIFDLRDELELDDHDFNWEAAGFGKQLSDEEAEAELRCLNSQLGTL